MADSDDDTYKLVHGILMGTAWLVLAPIAIGASLIRRISPAPCCLNQNGFWFQIHFYCQILVIWSGDDDGGSGNDDRIRFLKDIWEEEEEDEDNDDYNGPSEDSKDNSSEDENLLLFPAFGWTEDDAEENIHPKIGVSILAIVLFQAFLGLIRPHIHAAPPPSSPPVPSKPTNNSTTTSSSSSSNTEQHSTNDNNNTLLPTNTSTIDGIDDSSKSPALRSGEIIVPTNSNSNSNDVAATKAGDEDDHSVPKPTKTRIRVIWEWCHRCLGLVLLGLSWLQCIIGIRIFRN
jgi:hypothetical protein